jgi:hypothetical protein
MSNQPATQDRQDHSRSFPRHLDPIDLRGNLGGPTFMDAGWRPNYFRIRRRHLPDTVGWCRGDGASDRKERLRVMDVPRVMDTRWQHACTRVWGRYLGPVQEGRSGTFATVAFRRGLPGISPDGRWLAYTSTETGQPEVYVQPYPGPGPKVQISSDGGLSAVWARNGKELFYLTPRDGNGMRSMMAVDIVPGPVIRASRPRLLFRGIRRYISSEELRRDAGRPALPHGRARPSSVQEVTELQVVLNWFEELKGLVPTQNSARFQ